MKPSIAEMTNRMRSVPLGKKIAHVAALIPFEKPHSIRRQELEAWLLALRNEELRREIRSRGQRVRTRFFHHGRV